MLILIGHGGNASVRTHLEEVNNDLPDFKLNWFTWWASHSIEAIAQEHDLKPSHANWLEAFSFTIVNDLPRGKKTPPTVSSSIMDANAVRTVYGDGSCGGEYQVDEAIMQAILEATLKDILLLLKFEKASLDD